MTWGGTRLHPRLTGDGTPRAENPPPRAAVCEVPGCGARTHGHGLCRTHYDESRYLDTTGQSPEAKARAEREHAIYTELTLGTTTHSVFASEDEHRRAWEERRDELLSEYLTPPSLPGHRPAAWWHFEAGRLQHLTPYPLRIKGSIEERADRIDAYYIEPLVFLAENGHLTDGEIAALAEAAEEARPRIGTLGEHIGSGGLDRVDRRRVRIWNAVEAALKASKAA